MFQGCNYCRHCAAADMIPRIGQRISCKWGRFEVRGQDALQACNIKQHCRSTVHRTAERCFRCPDAPVVEFLQQQPGDEDLLRGNVPQPEDWLRAWRCCKTTSSFSAAQEQGTTEHYISGGNHGTGDPRQPATRKAIRKMVSAMAEAVRASQRDILRKARSVSIAVDDRKDFRLIRFRCDYVNVNSVSGNQHSATGILSCRRLGGCASWQAIEDFDQDKSRDMADSILRAIDAFCTVDGALDVSLRDHIVQNVRHFIADGGSSAQRAGRMLARGDFPNLVLVARDPAHTARITVRDPLRSAPRFAEIWGMLFDQQHALVPNIMNS